MTVDDAHMRDLTSLPTWKVNNYLFCATFVIPFKRASTVKNYKHSNEILFYFSVVNYSI